MPPQPPLKVLQYNCNRSRTALDALCAYAVRARADVLLLSEPNKRLGADGVYVMDCRKDTAARVFNQHVAVEARGQGVGHSWVQVNGVLLVSTYVSPNVTRPAYEEFLQAVSETIRSRRNKGVVVGGDFNARSRVWNSDRTDWRGDLVLDWAAADGLTVLNQGDTPTFERGLERSIIDVTLAGGLQGRTVDGWKVLNRISTISDHNCIEFSVRATDGNDQRPEAKRPIAWRFDPLIKPELVNAVTAQFLGDEKVATPQTITNALRLACDELLPRKGNNPRRASDYWWNETVAQKHSEHVHLRREVANARRRQGSAPEGVLRRLAEAKRNLRQAIEASKRAAWDQIRRDLDVNPWGKAYTIAKRKFGAPSQALSQAQMLVVTSALFPCRRLPRYENWEAQEVEVHPFSLRELQRAAAKLKPGKAGGPDGIPPEVIRAAVVARPDTVLACMNYCLRTGQFPRKWKRGKLVLIPKPGKPPGDPGSFRPLCLLDSAGKLLEHLVLARLKVELREKGAISDTQFGFAEGKSTTDAVRHILHFARERRERIPMALFLDVKNAFNSAPWDRILDRLRELRISAGLRRMIESYLRDRRALARTSEGTHSLEMTCGVPQGSVLGPTLWNVLYDGALRVELPEGCSSIAYADDFGLEIVADSVGALRVKAEDCYGRIARWARANGLMIEATKTEAIMLVGRRRMPEIDLRLEEHSCRTSTHVKYLGIWLSRNGSFMRHVKEQAARASAALNALTGILANTRGPGQAARKAIGGAVMSILRYGSEVWAESLTREQWKRLESVQRRVALRVIGGYRTVSTDASLVLASMLPLHLELTGAGVAEWQEEWSHSTNGAWTRELIPEVGEWTGRRHGEVSYHLTQLLSGHGNLGAYLNRFAIRDEEVCTRCGAAREDARHVLLECRGRALQRNGRIQCGTPREFLASILASPEAWENAATFAREALTGD